MTLIQRFYLTLADLVLLIHAAYITFVVVGLAVIWTGWVWRWAFVRNFWFRVAHLTAIGVVVAEAVSKIECPLTTWEDQLRLLAGGQQYYAGSFMATWVHRLIFFNVDEHTFTVIYIVFFSAVALSLWLVPPRWPRRGRGTRNQS